MSNQNSAIEILSHFTAQLSILHRIYLELSRIDTFDELCRQAVVLWRDKLKMGRLGIWMVCPDRPNYLCGAFGVDETGEIRDERGQSFENDAPIFLQILQDQQQVYYNANHPLLDHRSTPVGIGETAAAALWDGARVLGFVVTDNLLSSKPITETERQMLYLFGQMLGHLVSQKRAESAIRENERRYRLINEMTQAIIREGNFQDTLQILVSRFAELLEARHCHVILWDTASQRVTGWANAAQTRYPPTADEIAFTGNALQSGVPQMYHSDNPGEGLSGECLALPLIAKQQSLGAILLDTDPGRTWSKNQLETGINASAQVALALLQAKLLEQTQQQLRETETLRESGIAVAAALKQDEAIERILEELNRVVPYDGATVQLKQDDHLIVIGAHGFANQQAILGMQFLIAEHPLAQQAVEQKAPYILHNAPPEYQHARHDHDRDIQSWMGVPILLQDRVIGKLTLDSYQPERFTSAHARLATAFAAHVAIALENARLFNEVERLATYDFLTGVYNRRTFMELAGKIHQRAQRYNESLTVVMVDIDQFKKINDTYGHQVGDQVLHVVAKTCQQNLRSVDLLGRYGGEEFIILLPLTSASTADLPSEQSPAVQMAERLRSTIAEIVVPNHLGDIHLTISLGIAGREHHGDDLEQLIKCADMALYESKKNGRNRVTVFSGNGYSDSREICLEDI